MAPVISHAIDWCRDRGEEFDIVCLVQTTTPLRAPSDIDGTLEALVEMDASSAISVTEFLHPPQWALSESEDGYLTPHFDGEGLWGGDRRTQELEGLRHPNGAVFAAWVDVWDEVESFYTDETVAYEMPPERSFDIDHPWELEMVRALAEYDATGVGNEG